MTNTKILYALITAVFWLYIGVSFGFQPALALFLTVTLWAYIFKGQRELIDVSCYGIVEIIRCSFTYLREYFQHVPSYSSLQKWTSKKS